MSEEKLVLVSFLLEGNWHQSKTWCISLSHDDYTKIKKEQKKSRKRSFDGLMPGYLIKAIQKDTGCKKVVLPELLGDAPKGTKPGEVDPEKVKPVKQIQQREISRKITKPEPNLEKDPLARIRPFPEPFTA